MFQAVTRATRPAVAATAAAATTSTASTPPSGPPVVRAEALRATTMVAPPEVPVEELTVFPGKDLEAKDAWNVVDVFGEEITEEEVRDAIEPVLDAVHSPTDSDSSDGMTADCLIQQADSIMKSVQALANDRNIQMAVMNHPAFMDLLPHIRQGNNLLPAAAAVASQSANMNSGSTVTIEEIPDKGRKNILELFGAGLKAVGDGLASAFKGAGEFFRGIADKFNSKETVKSDSKEDGAGGSHPGWEGGVFLVVFGLVCVVLLSVLAKRAG